jgi:hypothetical protein
MGFLRAGHERGNINGKEGEGGEEQASRDFALYNYRG